MQFKSGNEKHISKSPLLALIGIALTVAIGPYVAAQEASTFPFQPYSVTVTDAQGNIVTVTVPPFAHRPDRRLTVTLLDEAPAGPFSRVLFSGVRLQPHDLVLTGPALVTFQFAQIPDGIAPGATPVVFKDASADRAVPLATEILEGGRVLQVRAMSFSELYVALPTPAEFDLVIEPYEGGVVIAPAAFLDLVSFYEAHASLAAIFEATGALDRANAFRTHLIEGVPGQIKALLEGGAEDSCSQTLPLLLSVQRNDRIIFKPSFDRIMNKLVIPPDGPVGPEADSDFMATLKEELGGQVALENLVAYFDAFELLGKRIASMAEACPPKATWRVKLQSESTYIYEFDLLVGLVAVEAPGVTVVSVHGKLQLLIDDTVRGQFEGSIAGTAPADIHCPEFRSDVIQLGTDWTVGGSLVDEVLTFVIVHPGDYFWTRLGQVECADPDHYVRTLAYVSILGPVFFIEAPFQGTFERTTEGLVLPWARTRHSLALTRMSVED